MGWRGAMMDKIKPSMLIKHEWESYRKEVVPANAGVEQLQETRRAFYAGAQAYRWLVINHVAALPDDKAELEMQALDEELKRFKDRVLRGGA
jgi:hypothetical protein